MREDDVLLLIDTDKVTIDVRYTASEPGTLKEYLVKEDDTVSVGQEVVVIKTGNVPDEAPAAAAPKEEKPAAEAKEAAPKKEPAPPLPAQKQPPKEKKAEALKAPPQQPTPVSGACACKLLHLEKCPHAMHVHLLGFLRPNCHKCLDARGEAHYHCVWSFECIDGCEVHANGCAGCAWSDSEARKVSASFP